MGVSDRCSEYPVKRLGLWLVLATSMVNFENKKDSDSGKVDRNGEYS